MTLIVCPLPFPLCPLFLSPHFSVGPFFPFRVSRRSLGWIDQKSEVRMPELVSDFPFFPI